MTTARFCTSWATSEEAVNALIQDIEKTVIAAIKKQQILRGSLYFMNFPL